MQQLDKWNKELTRLSIANLKETDSKLYNHYKDALRLMKVEIKSYIDNYENLSFSKRLEVERQLQMANKIDAILSDLNKWSESDIRKNIEKEIKVGYYGTWYALEGAENIQLDFAILPEKYIEELVNTGINGQNFSERLYRRRNLLANNIKTTLINGAAMGKGYREIAKEIGEHTEANYKQALRIARTEGGRAQSASKQKAYQEAKDMGVRIKKRWLATLDRKTRHQHQILDGQTVEIEEQFEFEGNKADGPRLFGVAGLDINCRCTTITVVNGISPELRKDNENKEIIKYNNYKEWFEDKGYKQREVKVRTKKISLTETMAKTNMKKMVGERNYESFVTHLENVKDEKIVRLYEKHGSKIHYEPLGNSGNYATGSRVQLDQKAFDGIVGAKPPLQTVYHENGHALDSLGLKLITGDDVFLTGNKVKRKVLRKTIEVDETIRHASGLPQYKLKETIDRDLWEYINGEELPMLSDLGKKPRKKVEKLEWENKRSEIYQKSQENTKSFMDKMKNISKQNQKATTAISDIIESTGFLDHDYPLGWGHGKAYWKTAGNAETEFFAHVSELLATNPDGYELMNEIFPNSIKVWENIVEDIIKVVD